MVRRYAHPTSDHDAELDALVAMLSEASLVEEDIDVSDRPALRLTATVVQIGRAMAMAGDDADAEAMLDALSGAR